MLWFQIGNFYFCNFFVVDLNLDVTYLCKIYRLKVYNIFFFDFCIRFTENFAKLFSLHLPKSSAFLSI